MILYKSVNRHIMPESKLVWSGLVYISPHLLAYCSYCMIVLVLCA